MAVEQHRLCLSHDITRLYLISSRHSSWFSNLCRATCRAKPWTQIAAVLAQPSTGHLSLSLAANFDTMKKIGAAAALALIFILALATCPRSADAGLLGILGYGTCQSGCNAIVVACYAAAGVSFGTVTAGAGTPAVIVGCNAALGTCMAACAAVALAPMP